MGRLRTGRFKSQGVIVRDLEDTIVVFWNSYCIYVKDKKNSSGYTIYHRYFTPKGYYTGNWRVFRRKMLRTKKLTIARCAVFASKYDVISYRTIRELDLSKVKVIKRG